LGAFASGFFLYGIALVYAATGTIDLTSMNANLAKVSAALPGVPLLPIGMGLLIVGFGFKVALVPFHMWTPDVYQGGPTPVVAFMSVATKAAAFAALIRVLTAVTTVSQPWLLALAILAVLTMTLGNLAALRQNSLKRMLAYSSIAQAGYVLTGLAAGNAQGVQGAMYYLVAYTFMNIGAFAVVLVLQRQDESDVTMDRLVGLSRRRPAIAALMAVFMFSLTGIPPLAGFFGKLYVFSAAVQGGMAWLAVIGMLNSAIAAYYYLRVTVTMYMAEPAPEPVTGGVPGPATSQLGRAPRPVERPARTMGGERMPEEPALARPNSVPLVPTRWPIWTAVVIAALGTVLLGLWQAPLFQSITQAVAPLAVH
jgi:NADH-quinone oxidoreductase subunit N